MFVNSFGGRGFTPDTKFTGLASLAAIEFVLFVLFARKAAADITTALVFRVTFSLGWTKNYDKFKCLVTRART